MPSYEELRPQLKTGDIVLLGGTGPTSDVIRLFTGSLWSHIGMIVRFADLDDAVFIWEAAPVLCGWTSGRSLSIKGVSLSPLSQRVAHFDGMIGLRQLSKPVTKPMQRELAALRYSLSRRPFERHELDRIKSVCQGKVDEFHEDISVLLSAQLVAEAYQAMGLLTPYPNGWASSEYTPMDFSERRELTLLEGFELQEQVTVT